MAEMQAPLMYLVMFKGRMPNTQPLDPRLGSLFNGFTHNHC